MKTRKRVLFFVWLLLFVTIFSQTASASFSLSTSTDIVGNGATYSCTKINNAKTNTETSFSVKGSNVSINSEISASSTSNFLVSNKIETTGVISGSAETAQGAISHTTKGKNISLYSEVESSTIKQTTHLGGGDKPGDGWGITKQKISDGKESEFYEIGGKNIDVKGEVGREGIKIETSYYGPAVYYGYSPEEPEPEFEERFLPWNYPQVLFGGVEKKYETVEEAAADIYSKGTYMSDQELYGSPEAWANAPQFEKVNFTGDCEDGSILVAAATKEDVAIIFSILPEGGHVYNIAVRPEGLVAADWTWGGSFDRSRYSYAGEKPFFALANKSAGFIPLSPQGEQLGEYLKTWEPKLP